jgi:hypothetical protein
MLEQPIIYAMSKRGGLAKIKALNLAGNTITLDCENHSESVMSMSDVIGIIVNGTFCQFGNKGETCQRK